MTGAGVSDGVAATLERAFAILREDAAEAYRAVALEIEDGNVALIVSGEHFTVGVEEAAIIIAHDERLPAALVQTRRDIVLDLIDGRTTILDAVLARDLSVDGKLDFLVRLSRAVSLFAGGALGSRRMRALLADFRSVTTPDDGR